MSLEQYAVLEIFDSFQGEGRYLGVPCTFVRFAGCNLSCPWCDTKQTMEEKPHMYMTAKQIAERCNETYVVFTGGEPLLNDLWPIVKMLDITQILMLETNGTCALPGKFSFDYIACSPKPQSKYQIHPSIRDNKRVDYKYVVDDVLRVDDIYFSSKKESWVFLQPEAHNIEKSVARAREIVDLLPDVYRPRVRLGIQAHKVWEVE